MRGKKDPAILKDLARLVEPETAGNPCSGEKWVRSRLRSLSEALDHRACPTTIGRLLRKQGYGLRSHRKVLHISVDAKKKELVGNFKNAGQSWRQEAEEVNAHDFPQDAECRASQYGIYDPERNEGHVCVATSADTADFAVDAIADWWRLHRPDYPQRKRLMIEADGGGSNAARSRRFKKRLQDFADENGLEITVCHYPPGTSKWNPIEHRLFSQITATWAGFVLSTLAVLMGFIRRTTTRTGLRVTATHFEKTYQIGQRVSNVEFKAIELTRHAICPQWNYTIHPRASPQNAE